jgi:polyribonucleotide nucleotidyltransferase
MTKQKFETEIGGRKLIVTCGELAGQANGSCTVQYGETLVLATATMSANVREGVDWLPLSVDYEERFYAAGKIKGSRFIKRETRPPDEAILAGRLIDRSLRPLFNQEIRQDIQVILTVLSIDQENDPDIVALYAASLAMAISDIPWDGPVVGLRIGLIPSSEEGQPDEWSINPTYLPANS